MRLMNNRQEKTKSVSISNTMIVYVFMFLVVIIAISFYYFFIEQVLVEALRESNDKTIEQYIDKVSYKSNVYIALSKSVSVNREIVETLLRQEEMDMSNTINMHRVFNDAINKNLMMNDIQELNEIKIYALAESFPIDGIFISNIYEEGNDWWLNEIKGSKGRIIYQSPQNFQKGQVLFVQPIINYGLEKYGELLGYVKISVEASVFFESQNAENTFQVCDSNGEIIKGINFEDNHRYVNSMEFQLGKDNYAGLFEIKYEYDYEGINGGIGRARLYMFLVIIIVVFIMLAIRYNTSKSYLERINRMIFKMKKIEKGDFNGLPLDERDDEIGVLDTHFNEMAMKLDQLISKTYLQELENKEAKIKALQYQIDPHFLFNTLESINALAVIDNNKDISCIIESLGLIYRYIVDKESGDFVTLKQEITHVKNYIKIQQYRFGFDVEYQIHPKLEKCIVPKLVIQPFIENAINYGKGDASKKLKLILTVELKGGNIKLSIQDNGVGIDEKTLESLRIGINSKTMKNNSKHKNIGIRNVNQRLKLNYGESYGVSINSQQGEGTNIVIIIPYKV